jgi:caa(3)-type oxidase subunit IV
MSEPPKTLRWSESYRLATVSVALIALTAATVGLSFVDFSHRLHSGLGLGIAALKSSLVALFFMDLVSASKAIWAVVIVALFWLFAVLFGLAFTDYSTRSLTYFLAR